MKQLLIIRHAKSSWDASAVLNDFDRPLNDRGLKDAPAMAKKLLEKKIKIDAFISSTAKRAFTTATYFAEAYGLKEKQVISVPELYHADSSVFYKTISGADNAFHTIAVFSHNPAITHFVNELSNVKIDNMPTCGIFAVNVETDDWKEFKKATKTFWFFDYPKAI